MQDDQIEIAASKPNSHAIEEEIYKLLEGMNLDSAKTILHNALMYIDGRAIVKSSS